MPRLRVEDNFHLGGGGGQAKAQGPFKVVQVLGNLNQYLKVVSA